MAQNDDSWFTGVGTQGDAATAARGGAALGNPWDAPPYNGDVEAYYRDQLMNLSRAATDPSRSAGDRNQAAQAFGQMMRSPGATATWSNIQDEAAATNAANYQGQGGSYNQSFGDWLGGLPGIRQIAGATEAVGAVPQKVTDWADTAGRSLRATAQGLGLATRPSPPSPPESVTLRDGSQVPYAGTDRNLQEPTIPPDQVASAAANERFPENFNQWDIYGVGGAVTGAANAVGGAVTQGARAAADYFNSPVDPRIGELGKPGAGSGDPRLTGGAGGGGGGGGGGLPGGFAAGPETDPMRELLGNLSGQQSQVYGQQSDLARSIFEQANGINLAAQQVGLQPQVGAIDGSGFNPYMISAPGQVAPMGDVMQVYGQLGAGPQLQGPGITVSGGFGTMGQSSAQQQGFLDRINTFLDTPDGPSIAEAQLRQAQADNAGQLIGAARSGRGGPGATAQALRGAISEGGAIASDTAGQMATLRAQEEDMRRNRQLSAMTAGGSLAGDIRSGDLSYRGQDLQALMADQGSRDTRDVADLQAGVQTRGQDTNALIADAGNQTTVGVANLNAGVQQRGQDVDVSVANQNAVGQNNRLQGDIAVANQGNMVTQRGQDADVSVANADRIARQDANALQGMTSLFSTGVQAQGQGLDYLGQSNQQLVNGQGDLLNYYTQQTGNQVADLASARNYDAQLQGIQAGQDPRTRGQAFLDNGLQALGQGLGTYVVNSALPSPVNAQMASLQAEIERLKRQQGGG